VLKKRNDFANEENIRDVKNICKKSLTQKSNSLQLAIWSSGYFILLE
jgi:hypothetical protein